MSIQSSKQIKYRKRNEQKMLQCVVRRDMSEFYELSNRYNITDFKPFVYYAIKHAHVDIAEELLRKIGDEAFPIIRNKISTKILLEVLKEISQQRTPYLFKYKNDIVSKTCSLCYQRGYMGRLIDIIDQAEKKQKDILIGYYRQKANEEVNRERGNHILEQLKYFDRENSINSLLDIKE